MATMKKIKENNPMFSFLGKDIREKASLAYDKGLECILKCQIKSNGRLTAWCQQHNEADLQPAWARAYEMPSICNGESVQIVSMLMSINNPDKRIIESVQGAIRWFNDSKILYTRIQTIPGPPEKSPYKIVTTDKIVVTDSTAPPIWTRFYEIGTERPLFSDRNSKLLYSMAEVSRERREGYGWYTYSPQGALENYPEWQKKWAPDNDVLQPKSPQLAFPGAEGFGRFVTGGRGGAVYEVTNLDDSGAGSLRDACSKTGARTIVFRVSGTIHLKSGLKIKDGDLTIAGQTAPGDGICVAGYELSISANNVIVRYMRFRLGNLNVAECECDAFGGRRISDVIIDHCSMSWSIDETGSFYDNTNFTMQWCLLSESLYNSGHKKGNHGYGGIQGGSGVTFHHNLYASHTSRNPRFSGGKYFATLGKKCLVDFRNNVIFNWGFNSVYGGENSQHNMINNYYKAGPATNENVKNRIVQVNRGNEPDPGKWHITGNFVTGFPEITADNWSGGVQGADANTAGVRMMEPFAFAPVTTQTPEDAYITVLKNAGAVLPKRDALDARIIGEVKSGTCAFGDAYDPKTGVSKGHTGIINSQATVGGWPVLKSVAAPLDTDKDGMPDSWEKSHGLNPKDASDGNKVGTNGYTMLEDYLNKDKF
jgi:pectate lyase